MNTDLHKMTIVQLRAYAKEKEVNVPSGLKKKDIIEYIIGCEEEIVSDEPQPTLKDIRERMVPVYRDEGMNWLDHYEEHHWAVVDLPNWNDEYETEFVRWLAEPRGLDVNNLKGWKGSQLVPRVHGIIKSDFAHAKILWKIRLECAPIFAELYDCDPQDLICSYDGACVILDKENSRGKHWIHNDTPRSMRDEDCCTQGLVNFLENGPKSGGLILVEGSYDLYSDYLDEHPSYGFSWKVCDMNSDMLKERRIIKICAEPGQLILWDSRTFHANTGPTNGDIRMCSYVSMVPRDRLSEKELKKHVDLYIQGKMTGHHCYGPYFKANAKLWMRGKEVVNGSQETCPILNPLMERLIGYK